MVCCFARRYNSGKVAVMFDQSGNGQVNYPDGKTVLSMSLNKCLLFKKAAGGKKGVAGGIEELGAGSGERKIKLSEELGVAFCAAPLKIEVYFRCKGVHCKFSAPGLFRSGSSVEVIKGKGDLFGEKDRLKVERKEQENLSHGDFLSAIQQAVAGL
jgi:hypothetical protein